MTVPGHVPFWLNECPHFECHAAVKHIYDIDIVVCTSPSRHVYFAEDVFALKDMSTWTRNTLKGYHVFRKQTILLQAPKLFAERVRERLCVNSGT